MITNYQKISQSSKKTLFRVLRQISYTKLFKKYSSGNFNYNKILANYLVFNDSCRIVARFKDYLILDDNTEFLRETINKNDKFKLLDDFDDFGILSENRKRIYYFGIIDILTEYGTAKHFEHFFKKIIYCSNEMSCIPPQNYMQRFYNYLNIVFAKADINNKEETSLFDKFNNNNLGYSYSVEKSNYINGEILDVGGGFCR